MSKVDIAVNAFYDKFKYFPNMMCDECFFSQSEYVDVLRKSIRDGFDYTIKRFGTVPPNLSLRGTTKVYID